MSSVPVGFKQSNVDSGYYIPVANLTGLVYARTSEPVGNTGVGGGSFSTATWAYFGAGRSLSTILAGAGLLRDMGRTVVSSLRTFRKVQVVLSNVPATGAPGSTFGVGGRATGLGEDYLTGYIEVGFEGQGTPAPVAHFGR
jgi:hypothetical protein